MTDKEFQSYIVKSLDDRSIRMMSEICKTSLPTIRNWITGTSTPHELIKEGIIKTLLNISIDKLNDTRDMEISVLKNRIEQLKDNLSLAQQEAFQKGYDEGYKDSEIYYNIYDRQTT